jgi:hypothetical protein
MRTGTHDITLEHVLDAPLAAQARLARYRHPRGTAQ